MMLIIVVKRVFLLYVVDIFVCYIVFNKWLELERKSLFHDYINDFLDQTV